MYPELHRMGYMFMYNNIKSRVKFQNELSQEFSCITGVRQGERLSPFLFTMFLNDIESEFITHGKDGIEDWHVENFPIIVCR